MEISPHFFIEFVFLRQLHILVKRWNSPTDYEFGVLFELHAYVLLLSNAQQFFACLVSSTYFLPSVNLQLVFFYLNLLAKIKGQMGLFCFDVLSFSTAYGHEEVEKSGSGGSGGSK